jgi:hypothetical protein
MDIPSAGLFYASRIANRQPSGIKRRHTTSSYYALLTFVSALQAANSSSHFRQKDTAGRNRNSQQRARLSPANLAKWPTVNDLQDWAMRNKWIRRVKRFIELFTPGGSIYSKSGIEARVGHHGGFEVPLSERKKLLYQHLDEMERLKSRWLREQLLDPTDRK